MSSGAHICHLTVLNPALHSRIYYKEALTQVAAGYRVSIIGQDGAHAPYFHGGVRIVPTGNFTRLSWRRLAFQLRILRLLRAEAADIYIVHSPELLPVARRLKTERPQVRIVYDMHEDYAANIRHAGYYPELLRGPLMRRVRSVEADFAQWGDGLQLAERCFLGILDFPADRTLVLENKFQAPAGWAPVQLPDTEVPTLLYTGTVAENWGVLRALDLWQRVNGFRPVRLALAGIAYDEGLRARIHAEVAASGHPDRFEWIGDGDYVPHPEILAAIARCHIGLAPYKPLPHLRERIPTRFFEYMAARRRLVYTRNPTWDALNDALGFGIAVGEELEDADVQAVLQALDAPLPPAIDPQAWAWEGKGMVEFLGRLTVR